MMHMQRLSAAKNTATVLEVLCHCVLMIAVGAKLTELSNPTFAFVVQTLMFGELKHC